MNRRTALKVGASVTFLALTGLYGGYRLLPPGRSRTLEGVDVLARRLYISLDEDQRAETCVAYDHPMRQYHNRGVWGGGRSILFGFNREQRSILTDLLYAGLSEEGRERVPEEYFSRWTGVHLMRVLICGDPTASPYQMILTGTHLNLRLGGKSREGAAFGGPQVYGDQRGNERAGLPGNLLAQQLVDRIFSTYPPDDVTYARECLDANGGLDALFLTYYQHGEDGEIPEGQVFRLEGPGAVFHFRGYPHVHAFLNVAMDGDAPLSVGEPVGNNPAWLDHAGVKALFETALRAETGADLAYYDESSVAGRLRPGLIRSGDIYSLESWQETAEVVEIRGSNLSAPLLAVLRGQAIVPDSDKTYTVATTTYVINDLREKLGRIDTRRPGPMLRELTIAYLRSHGFPKG